MRVAIVHYHLRPGGVTSVIRAVSGGLSRAGIRHVALCGEGGGQDFPACVVAGLGYGRHEGLSAAGLVAEMKKAAGLALGGPPDLWHFHNHSLGKSALMADVVASLAEEGARLLLQIHDLAEDGRPANHRMLEGAPRLYPTSPRIHYVFLNARDRVRFLSAGLPEESAFILPNPVLVDAHPAARDGAPLVLYPTRAIRRKNLGEFLLLAMIAPAGTRFAVSRLPEDPEALALHEEWRHFSEELRLPVEFGVVDRLAPHPGADASYGAWLAAATHLATTSIAEGYGMVFPEAAALGRPLIGRRLPDVPGDAAELYDCVRIPLSWLDRDLLRLHFRAAVTRTWRLYGREPDEEVFGRALAALECEESFLDFGNLPEVLQRRILRKIHRDSADGAIIGGVRAEIWLSRALADAEPPRVPAVAGDALPALYRDLLAAPEGEVSYLDRGKVLDACLRPEDFHFLLTRPPRIRAVVFDIYGTLLVSRGGAVRPDPGFDGRLAEILRQHGAELSGAATARLHSLVLRDHAASPHLHPEVDLLALWGELLGPGHDVPALLTCIEREWHPCTGMPGARMTLDTLAERGILLGLLSNAQANTLPALDEALGPVSARFPPDLSILSWRHGMAKPSHDLFSLMAERLAGRGIAPSETLYVGNDPLQDIVPAATAGFLTALFTGHPDSLREGECAPDFVLDSLPEVVELVGKPD